MSLVGLLWIFHIALQLINVSSTKPKCITHNNDITYQVLAKDLLTEIIPSLDELNAGSGGKIGVIGGSIEYTGSTYVSAISALRVGADFVYVLTTEGVASILRSYSTDIVVFAYLNKKHISKITSFISKMDLLIVGPGSGRENSTINLIIEVINTCKRYKKPLILTGNGLYAVSRNIKVIQNYPQPGVILIANHFEASNLVKSIANKNKNRTNWYHFWGENVSVLIESKDDHYVSSYKAFSWLLLESGSSRRRVGSRSDILSGFLGTLYNWALKTNFCDKAHKTQLAQSVSTYGAVKLTQMCHHYAYIKYGRNTIASDMLNEIHLSFNEVFTK